MFHFTPVRENMMIRGDWDKWDLEKPIVRGREGDLFEIYNDCKAEAINIVGGHTVPAPATQYSESQAGPAVLLFLQQITSANEISAAIIRADHFSPL